MGRKSKGDTSNYYIDPNELKESVIEMQELGYMTERFAKHLLTIQEKVIQFPRYRGYPEEIKEEMRSHNQMRWVMKGWQTIKADKNCFAYITQGCYLNFLQAVTNYFRRFNKFKEYLKLLYEQNGLDWKESGYEQASKSSDIWSADHVVTEEYDG